MKDNGLAILHTYCMDSLYEVQYGGWCELHTMTAMHIGKVGAEDKEILKEIGWEQIEPHTWKLEWWN